MVTLSPSHPSPYALLSPRSQECISRLAAYACPADILPDGLFPPSKRAAVLVLLVERDGQLRVLLTTRSKSLRSHPGQTALPGGRIDPSDVDAVDAAFREAFEEVALPRAHPAIHTLCILRPFLSQFKLHVTPIVALLYDHSSPSTSASLLDALVPAPAEVDCIFHFPLEAVLDPVLLLDETRSDNMPALAEKGSENWPYDEDLHTTQDYPRWLQESTYRMHRFRSCASPVKGLTADILLYTAELAYGRPPTFERYAPTQPRSFSEMARLLHEHETAEAARPSATP